jgi:glycerophosphoryl diester phosphodiesterase
MRWLVIILLFQCLSTDGSRSHLFSFKAKKYIVVISHRGNHTNVPENTLQAFLQAIDCGADYVEVDVRMTKDEQFIVMHNATVDKMTNGSGAIKELGFEEIKKLRINNQNNDGKIYLIPSFEEILELCRGKIKIYLDFKDGDVEKAFNLIKKHEMQNDVAVYINSEKLYDEWKKIAPELPLISSIPSKASFEESGDFLQIKKINIVDNAYESSTVKFLHKKNIKIWLDVESDEEGPEVWQKALNLNIDGLQTDHPEQLIQYLISKKLR